MIAEWVAIGLTIAALIVQEVRYRDKLNQCEGAMKEKIDNLARALREHDEQHADHYKHALDANSHWTQRERDMLQDTVDDLRKDIKELLHRQRNTPK